MIFRADAADETGDQPALGDIVDHRVFFGDLQRVLAQRNSAADDGDLGPAGAPAEGGCGNDRRRHGAIGILVMLVYRQDVVAQLLAILELIQIAIIELRALLGVVVAVWQQRPGGRVFLVERKIQVGIGHQMKQRKLHLATPL